MRFSLAAFVVTLGLTHSSAFAQVDEEAATKLLRKGECHKCHSLDKKKKAPSYRDIAQKYRGKVNAEREMTLHITGNPIVKLDEGEEKHIAPDTKDPAELRNLVRWVLSR